MMHSPSELQEIIEKYIAQIALPEQPKNLYEPIRYLMGLGGKRIRPVMLMMAAELFDDDISKTLDVALAIEVFHNFTLVHDDIMDNAPLRRGKITVHEKWGVNTAILVGDVMMVETNKHLCKADAKVLKPVLDTFNQTAQEVCEGQQLDMEFESRSNVSIAEYVDMIRKKTAVLLGGAMKLGAIVAGADEKSADLLYQFGENLGIAFQLQDDILDVYGNPEKFGKQVGGDIISNKKTFLHLKAKELVSANEHDVLLGEYESNANKISAVTQLYNQYNIKTLANKEMSNYLAKAYQALDELNVIDDKKSNLRTLAQQIMEREY
jgi:geranylgeranyl diphosphate synthase type II